MGKNTLKATTVYNKVPQHRKSVQQHFLITLKVQIVVTSLTTLHNVVFHVDELSSIDLAYTVCVLGKGTKKLFFSKLVIYKSFFSQCVSFVSFSCFLCCFTFEHVS